MKSKNNYLIFILVVFAVIAVISNLEELLQKLQYIPAVLIAVTVHELRTCIYCKKTWR